MQALLDVTPIELPKSLIDMEIGRLMQQAREDRCSAAMAPK